VLAALNTFPITDYWLFDGELRHHKTKGIKNKLVLYDVFIRAGELLIALPFRDRRKILESLMSIGVDAVNNVLTIPPQFTSGFDRVFKALVSNPEYEGLVLKNLDGRLDLGRKSAAESRWMFKVRRASNSYSY
jgi:ATP-dependent DNA ligase